MLKNGWRASSTVRPLAPFTLRTTLMAILTSVATPLPAPQGAKLWQVLLREAIRDLDQLCAELLLDPELLGADHGAAVGFPVLVPRPYLSRIRPGDPTDPLLRQVIATSDEKVSPSGFVSDPVGDAQASLAPGILKKYGSRMLVVTTGACAIHCRYCFRREFPYVELPAFTGLWDSVVEQASRDESIREVILSGGDPLVLSDERLGRLASRLAEVPHVRRLRIHSRLPIVIPERVDADLLSWLRGTRLSTIMVVHVNHPQEIDDNVANALGRLVDAGVPVLNQAVLLRGVNDEVNTLCELSERLIDLRVMPYYLHQLDRVQGAAHFEVDELRGKWLVEQLRQRLPGYAVPRYVREIAEMPYKVLL